jgi:hypothetical protein
VSLSAKSPWIHMIEKKKKKKEEDDDDEEALSPTDRW